MPFEKGNLTFRICRLPEALPQNVVELFAQNAAGPLEGVMDEPQWGWVTPRHLLDTNITEDAIKMNGYYHICLRQAQRKIPASLLSAECRIAELSKMAEMGVDHLAKKERKAIKEEVSKHLLPQMPPQLAGTYCVIDTAENLLFTTAVSSHAFEIFAAWFLKTIGFEPIPLTPEVASASLFNIDGTTIPALCISPNLNRKDGEGNGTLGENFLTWLWYFQEARGGMLPQSKLGSFGLMIDGPLAFIAEGAGAFESVVRKGTPTLSAEAKAALLVGKKLKSAKFILAQDKNVEWSCTLDANEFIFRGLKLPEGEAMDPLGIFEERMTNLYTFHSVFFGLFQKFLTEMADSEKANAYREKAREWISNHEER